MIETNYEINHRLCLVEQKEYFSNNNNEEGGPAVKAHPYSDFIEIGLLFYIVNKLMTKYD